MTSIEKTQGGRDEERQGGREQGRREEGSKGGKEEGRTAGKEEGRQSTEEEKRGKERRRETKVSEDTKARRAEGKNGGSEEGKKAGKNEGFKERRKDPRRNRTLNRGRKGATGMGGREQRGWEEGRKQRRKKKEEERGGRHLTSSVVCFRATHAGCWMLGRGGQREALAVLKQRGCSNGGGSKLNDRRGQVLGTMCPLPLGPPGNQNTRG